MPNTPRLVVVAPAAMIIEVLHRDAGRFDCVACDDAGTLLSQLESAAGVLVLIADQRAIAALAHDLNNILHVISGNVDLIDHLADDPRLKRFSATVKRAAGRGAELTAQLLAFGDIKNGVMMDREGAGMPGEALRPVVSPAQQPAGDAVMREAGIISSD